MIRAVSTGIARLAVGRHGKTINPKKRSRASATTTGARIGILSLNKNRLTRVNGSGDSGDSAENATNHV